MRFRTDIHLTDDGDLVLEQILGSGGEPLTDWQGTPIRDFSIAQDRQVATQGSMCRIKTQISDWRVFPTLGADLERFVGELNTPETAELIVENIRHSLIYDFFIDRNKLEVYAVPVNENEVIFYIRIEYHQDAPMVFAIPFDYYKGIGGQED